MQAAEKQKFFLHAIDGGLARMRIRVLAGAAAAGDADLVDALDALGRVLTAADARIGLDVMPTVDGWGYDAGLVVSGAAPFGGVSLTSRRVRAFAPAIKARSKDLDLLIVSAPGATSPADTDTLAAAADMARRFGREQLCVLVDGDCEAAAATRTSLGADAASLGVAVDVRGVAAVAGAIAAGTAAFDTLLVSEPYLEVITAVAAGVAGANALVTQCATHDDAMIVSSGLAGETALPAFAGLVLATAEMLIALGRPEAGARMADAWCRAVESGVHTADFDVTHPYGRLVDDAGFADAIVEFMGEAPRAVRPHFSGVSEQRASAGRRPVVRVIQGGR